MRVREKGINKLPPNMVHTILEKHKLASDQKSKQKRRKWVKYEGKHTNSLWHTDQYMLMDRRWMGKWLMVYIDDASSEYGKPATILTDHAPRFYANFGDSK
jgi:putative transposase